MEIKSRIWFFEGLDKSGKSTLCRACRFSSGHVLPMYDRGPVSRHLFVKYFGEREEKGIAWFDIELKLVEAGLYGLVYVKAPLAAIQERMHAAGEVPMPISMLEAQRRILEEILAGRKLAGIPFVVVDTEGQTVEEATKQALRAMELPFRKFSQGEPQ